MPTCAARRPACASLTTVLIIGVLLVTAAPLSAQNFDGSGSVGNYSLPPPPPTQQGVCVSNCGEPAAPPPANSYQPHQTSSPTYGGFTPQQQMMLQGAYGTGQAVGYALGRALGQALFGNPQRERIDAARKAQQENARKQTEEQERIRDEQEAEARHQRLMSQMMNLDGTIGVKGGGAGAPLTAKLMPLDEGGAVQPQAGTNFFGTNPGPSGNDAGVVDLSGTGANDPSRLKVEPSTFQQSGPCPLDANGMPECGAPAGAPMPEASGDALQQFRKYDPSALPAPPSPPQSAYDKGLAGQARQDAAAKSAFQASASEHDEVADQATEQKRDTVNVLEKSAEGAIHGADLGPGGATFGAALGAAQGAVQNRLDKGN
jgi:hypothetical protein